ncbi:platelet binding protein GspB-like isoform X5 [Pseudorasbora parva]|uniref:platelet binding protein GspB-like isoform X5 n=1 Tax=Pseudorasbora parva TaxID=51549 RepID=UPI00351DC974
MQGSTTYGGSLQPQGTRRQFATGSPSSYPSVSLSSQQGASSQSATVQSSQKQFTSSYGTQSGGSLQTQGTRRQFATGSPPYPSVSISSQQGASSQSATVQSSQKLSPSYGTQLGGSLQLQGTTRQFATGSPSYPSVSIASPQGAARLSATVQSSRKQFTSSYGTQSGGSLHHQGTKSQFTTGSSSSYPSVSISSQQGSTSQSATVQSSRKQFTSSYGTQSGGALQPQGTTSQFATGSPSYPSVSLSSPQGATSQSATVQSSQKQFTSRYGTHSGGSLQPQGTTSQFATGSPSYPSVSLSSQQGTASQSATVQSSQKLSPSYSTQLGGSLQPQGTRRQFATGSPSSYPSVSIASPQGAARLSATVQSSQKQFTSSYGTQSGGSIQPQGTTRQFATGSPSSYPSVSLSSPQGAARLSATVQSSRKQFTSSYGTQSGGSLQPQDTTRQFATGSPSYPSVSLSSQQGTASQSATVQSSQKLSPSYGTQLGGSLQPQGTTRQFATGSPLSYPSVSLSSPQGATSQSATVQSSRKQFTSSYGTPSGSSKILTMQGSTAYGGSLQPQGTRRQFATGSPSSYPSVSIASPQGTASQSATVQSSQKLSPSYSTQLGGSLQPQGTTRQFTTGSPSYPSVSLSSPQGAARLSATVQSSRKQFTSSYGTQSGGSLQPQGTTSQFATGSPSYPSVSISSQQGASSQSATVQSSQKLSPSYGTQLGGSLQLQGTTRQFATGSPSYPSVSIASPQGAARLSATVQSSRKQFTSSYGTQSGGSLQPQGTTRQFATGSPSYPSVSLSSSQGAARLSATVQSSRKQFTSSYGTQSGGSLQPQGTKSQFTTGSSSSYPSVSISSQQGTTSQSATVQSSRKQFTSSYGTQSGGSLQPQGTTSQFATGSPSYPSVSLSSQQGTASQSATVQSSQKLSPSYSTQLGGSLQPQGTRRQFATGSPSSYPSVSIASPQGAARLSATVQSSRKQFTSSYGTQSGGSLQPQGTTSQFATGSPSYPSVSISSPQGAARLSATVQSSRKQFTSSYGTQSGGSLQPQGTTRQFATGSPSYPSVSLSSQQGTASQSATVQSSQKLSPSYGTQLGGSLQPQGTTRQFATGSPSYPSVSLSSPQGATSQSATVQSSRKQFTSSYGTPSGSSKILTMQGSTAYGGSLQPQGTRRQFATGSPSSYPSVSIASPQGTASQSATVQSSQKLSPSYSTQLGGSLQPQGTTRQFATGSPSSYPSVSLSSPQGATSQSATVQNSQKQFTSRYGTHSGGSLQPQGTTSQFATGSPSYPSVSLSSQQGTASQSATVQSSQKLSPSYSTQLGGSLQPQGTRRQFATGSPSSYPSVSIASPQGAARLSATVQSSQKQFTSSYGTQSGGSIQPQGTRSPFALGSRSSYLSLSLSSPQGFASQAFQSDAVSQHQKSQRWPPSEGIQTSGAAVSQGASSVSEVLSSYGLFNQNTQASKPSRRFSSDRYYVKG